MKILLAVTGSISAYKILDLTRELTKSGHQIRIILTKAAEHFVVPKVFEYLGAEEIYSAQQDFTYKAPSGSNPVLHVELGNWADIMVIAPLSANTLSRLCHAQADDLLTACFLALKKTPLLIFPAMNTQMLNHPFVQENFSKLKTLSNIFIHPTRSGKLICNEEGEGKLPEIEQVKDFIESYPINMELRPETENLLITTGATIAPLDPVRFLTNSSSGITGFYLAKYALSLGKKVKVIAGQNATKRLDHLIVHPNFSLERVITTSEMKKAVMISLPHYPHYISSAAIGDFSFESSNSKLKKNNMPTTLKLNPEDDILKAVIESKQSKHIVGFAAESDLNEKILNDKLLKKPVNLLIGTKVNNGLLGDDIQGFSNDHAEYLIMDPKKKLEHKVLTKNELAKLIINDINAE